ncbi:hypothetical protein EVAR_75474_1 [Eumeta japonica]|uniref:Uncharacterized protein n=1 Tax=Eumeta variegata TaxID=151549 RepID=A0A4C1TN26_EUMVA|nr:hypothetical protein EVAR_75474_1 [Eumeta japonica]
MKIIKLEHKTGQFSALFTYLLDNAPASVYYSVLIKYRPSKSAYRVRSLVVSGKSDQSLLSALSISLGSLMPGFYHRSDLKSLSACVKACGGLLRGRPATIGIPMLEQNLDLTGEYHCA